MDEAGTNTTTEAQKHTTENDIATKDPVKGTLIQQTQSSTRRHEQHSIQQRPHPHYHQHQKLSKRNEKRHDKYTNETHISQSSITNNLTTSKTYAAQNRHAKYTPSKLKTPGNPYRELYAPQDPRSEQDENQDMVAVSPGQCDPDMAKAPAQACHTPKY